MYKSQKLVLKDCETLSSKINTTLAITNSVTLVTYIGPTRLSLSTVRMEGFKKPYLNC